MIVYQRIFPYVAEMGFYTFPEVSCYESDTLETAFDYSIANENKHTTKHRTTSQSDQSHSRSMNSSSGLSPTEAQCV